MTLTVPIQRRISKVRVAPVLRRRWAPDEIRMQSVERRWEVGRARAFRKEEPKAERKGKEEGGKREKDRKKERKMTRRKRKRKRKSRKAGCSFSCSRVAVQRRRRPEPSIYRARLSAIVRWERVKKMV